MPDYVVSDTSLTSVAGAIRTKGGTSETLSFPDGFISAISAIPSGGGASNYVTGEFNGTTTGQSIEVPLSYSGDGYPVALIVYPKKGISSNATFRDAIQQYSIAIYTIVKEYMTTSPDYAASGSNRDSGNVVMMYKSSTTNAKTYTVKQSTITSIYSSNNAVANSCQNIKIQSPTKMSVFIASNSYGFMANIDYTYHIIYSA